MNEKKERLLEEIESVLGLTPSNARLLLNVIIHPSIIEYTKAYIRSEDKEHQCQKYEAPWNCLKEAEARFENIKYGWLGSGTELELDWICETCHRRITED